MQRARRKPGIHPSLDYLVREQQHRRRDADAEYLRGVPVDHQFELGGLLNGEIGRMCALEDLVDVGCSPPEQVDPARRIRQQAAGLNEDPLLEETREPALQRKVGDALVTGLKTLTSSMGRTAQRAINCPPACHPEPRSAMTVASSRAR